MFCEKCGMDPHTGVAPSAQLFPQKRKSRKWLIVPITIAALFAIFIIYAAVTQPYVNAGPRPSWSMANFGFYTTMDVGGNLSTTPGPGKVVVWGIIGNQGTASGQASIHIKIDTGYGTKEFDAGSAVVQPGSQVEFQWEHHFDNLDPNTCRVWTSLPR